MTGPLPNDIPLYSKSLVWTKSKKTRFLPYIIHEMVTQKNNLLICVYVLFINRRVYLCPFRAPVRLSANTLALDREMCWMDYLRRGHFNDLSRFQGAHQTRRTHYCPKHRSSSMDSSALMCQVTSICARSRNAPDGLPATWPFGCRRKQRHYKPGAGLGLMETLNCA